MNFNMNIPGLKEVIINEMTEQENRIVLHISLPQKEHTCPDCGQKTDKVRFHYCRYIHWAVDEVRRKVQNEWNSYDPMASRRY